MAVKAAFILCAGQGTRMGAIGEVLPKPLWKVYEKPILGHVIEQAYGIGIKQIYINVFHQKELIKDYVAKSYPEVEVIEEDGHLGVGGAFHNLKKAKNPSKILKLNCDQLILTDWQNFLDKADDLIEGNQSVLGLMKVSGKYNSISFDENGVFRGVKKPSLNKKDYYTFSGVSLVDMDKLDYVPGHSDYFSTVSPVGATKVLALTDCEFWDFGTLENYWKNNWLALEDNSLQQFLIKTGGIKKERLGHNSYHFSGDNCLNFSEAPVLDQVGQKSIVLGPGKERYPDKEAIIYHDQIQEIE